MVVRIEPSEFATKLVRLQFRDEIADMEGYWISTFIDSSVPFIAFLRKEVGKMSGSAIEQKICFPVSSIFSFTIIERNLKQQNAENSARKYFEDDEIADEIDGGASNVEPSDKAEAKEGVEESPSQRPATEADLPLC